MDDFNGCVIDVRHVCMGMKGGVSFCKYYNEPLGPRSERNVCRFRVNDLCTYGPACKEAYEAFLAKLRD